MCNATPEAYESEVMDCCQLLVMKDMKQMCTDNDTAGLHSLMQYKNWQASYDIDYGGSPGGVFTAACPPGALCPLENGLMIHCLKQLFDHVLTAATGRKFDAVVQQWVLYPKQHHMRSYYSEYPRLLFTEGLSSITDISAQTKVGILFAIVVAALIRNGRQILLNDANLTENQYLNMIEVFELLLCYWEWIKKPEYWNLNDMNALHTAKASIHQLIQRLKLLFPRSAGN